MSTNLEMSFISGREISSSAPNFFRPEREPRTAASVEFANEVQCTSGGSSEFQAACPFFAANDATEAVFPVPERPQTNVAGNCVTEFFSNSAMRGRFTRPRKLGIRSFSRGTCSKTDFTAGSERVPMWKVSGPEIVSLESNGRKDIVITLTD